MSRVLCILCAVLFAVSCGADDSVTENRGISFILQMCSSKAKTQKKFWNTAYKDATVWNAGWMYGNTSNPNGCTWSSKFMAMNVKKRVRVHICNSTCFPERGRVCQQNECFAGMKTAAEASKAILNKNKKVYARIDNIITLAKKDIKLAPKGTLIDYAVNPCLECTLTKEARKTLLNYVERQFKNVDRTGMNPIMFVDNPLNGGYGGCFDGYLCESHGTPKGGKKRISDNDGVDYDTIAQLNYFSNNEKSWMVLAWKPCLNGMTGKETSFIAPQNRTAWCELDKDAPDFNSFTTSTFSFSPTKSLNKKDLQGCSKTYTIGKDYTNKNFVWKLGDGKKYTVWVAPKEFKKFSTVELRKNGKVVDRSYPQVGYRFGTEYTHDTPPKRRIYDFRKQLHDYPDNAVLHADSTCFIFEKPQFRPFAK